MTRCGTYQACGKSGFPPSDIEGEGHYWPLVYTTFWLEHKLWGFDPTGYHIVNVLLHLANTLLLWHLVRRLAVPGAWVVAAVFAVHPLHVESVAWVIERKDVLSGLFYLAAALAWMRFVEQPRPRYYVGSLALYAAALLSKSIAITLPAAFLIWHWWKQGRVTSTNLLRLVPFFAVGLAIAIGDLSFYWSTGAASFDYSLTERTLIAARALWFYAVKLLWPTNLAVIYPRWDVLVADPLAWGYLIAAVALVVALWCFRPQLGRGPLAGALFFAVTLSPILGFVDHGYMQYAFVADRFQYLAGIGVMGVVIGSATYGVGSPVGLLAKGCRGGAVAVLVVLGGLTWQQAGVWRDGETLWRHVVAHNPQAGEAHFNLGVILNKSGDFEGAERHFRRAIALEAQARDVHLDLGGVLYKQGRYAEAADLYRVVVQRRPDSVVGYTWLGLSLQRLGRDQEAVAPLRHALALSPQNANAIEGMAFVKLRLGDYDEALEFYQRLLHIDPDNAVAQGNMGISLYYLGRSDEALQSFDRALTLDPTLENVRANREAVLKAVEGN